MKAFGKGHSRRLAVIISQSSTRLDTCFGEWRSLCLYLGRGQKVRKRFMQGNTRERVLGLANIVVLTRYPCAGCYMPIPSIDHGCLDGAFSRSGLGHHVLQTGRNWTAHLAYATVIIHYNCQVLCLKPQPRKPCIRRRPISGDSLLMLHLLLFMYTGSERRIMHCLS